MPIPAKNASAELMCRGNPAGNGDSLCDSLGTFLREDDNGARFVIAHFDSRQGAEHWATELAHGGHKQYYFIEPVSGDPGTRPHSPMSSARLTSILSPHGSYSARG